MQKFTKITLGTTPRVELKETLALTGCEISHNILKAGQVVPFFHAHKENEEIYFFIEGEGAIELDGEKIAVGKNDILRVSPPVMRKMSAATDLRYLCIQVKENSLTQWTKDDSIYA